MDKQALSGILREFMEIHEEYFLAQQTSMHGKNQNRRQEGDSRMDVLRNRAKKFFVNYPELYDYVPFDDEFFTPQWFGNDLPRFIDKVQEIVNQ